MQLNRGCTVPLSIKKCFILSYSPTQRSTLTVSLVAGTEAQPRGNELLMRSH